MICELDKKIVTCYLFCTSSTVTYIFQFCNLVGTVICNFKNLFVMLCCP